MIFKNANENVSKQFGSSNLEDRILISPIKASVWFQEMKSFAAAPTAVYSLFRNQMHELEIINQPRFSNLGISLLSLTQTVATPMKKNNNKAAFSDTFD